MIIDDDDDDDIDRARRRADENAAAENARISNQHQNNNNHNSQLCHQNQNAIHPELQQQLKNDAGVIPSNYWLEQCLSHLRGVGNSGILPGAYPNEDESLFTQILHADLRDVVRDPFGNNNSNSGAGNDETAAAVQLRNAIIQSNRNVDNFSINNRNNSNSSNNNNNGKHVSSKVTLPSHFHLLIQMEEVIDVSLNAEQQLAAMGGGGGGTIAVPSANNNNMPNRNNPKNRCLKMVFSDGYHANGKPYPSNDNNNNNNNQIMLGTTTQILYAIETSQIQNLSMQSPPGIKLVLHGPIDVRLGILQLNDGNCKVIGGEIERWKDIQVRARERAQKQRGLGVDPTIKALIGVGSNDLEEDVDEGEGESGDVVVPAVAAAPLAAAQEPVITPPNQYNTGGQHHQQQHQQQQQQQPSSNMNFHAAASSQQHSYTTSNAAAVSSAANASSRSSGGNGGGNKRQQTMDAYPKKPRPETHRLLPQNNNASVASSRPQQPNASNNNPYQHPSNDSSIGQRNVAQPNNNLAPMFQQQPRRQQQPPQQQRPPPPPPIQNNSNVIPIDDSPPTSSSRKSSISQQQIQSNPYSSLRPAAATASNTTAATSSSDAPITFTSNPSFSELKSLLQSLRSDRKLYEQYYGKVITVPCKIDYAANEKVFNIARADKSDSSPKKKGKSSKKKEKKKYEFLMVSNFLGPKTSDGKVACRVISSVVEPYFDGHSPAEIRKLSREDKERANRIVNQSSSTFVHDFSSLCQLKMKLLLTADEFFAKLAQVPVSSCEWMQDTGNPFLLVLKKL